MMWVGAASKDITPRQPVELAGFADRKGPFSGVAHRLHLRAVALSDQRERLLLLTADTIWWGRDTVEALKKNWRWSAWRPVLHATHTHSAPHPSRQFARHLGLVNQDWLEFLLQQSLAAAQQAIDNLQQLAGLSLGKGRCFFPVFRRRKTPDGRVLMAPNFDGPHAQELTVLRMDQPDGRVHTLFVHLACHPTTNGDATVSAEFPGVACASLQRQTGAQQVVYLQGFCADQRPALIQGDRFFRGSAKDVDYLGGVLAEEVLRVLASGEMKKLDHEQLGWGEVQAALPQQTPLSTEQLQAVQAQAEAGSIDAHWAEKMLQGAHAEPRLLMQGMRWGRDLSLLTINAEVVLPYHGLLAKFFPAPHHLSLGYTQGMIGYLPTTNYLAEGGYEAFESHRYFLLAAPYHRQVEQVVSQQARDLAGQLFARESADSKEVR